MVKKRTVIGDNPLRNDILALLGRRRVSMDKALEAVSQCQAQLGNRILVEAAAKQCGLKLSSFLTDESLELYYDIKRGRHDLGFISKGWDDPGFRIGDLVHVPKRYVPRLKDTIFTLLRFCATRGVSVTIEDTREGAELQMDSVIYLEGFSGSVFEQVIHYLLRIR